jgi:hypothetical protein
MLKGASHLLLVAPIRGRLFQDSNYGCHVLLAVEILSQKLVERETGERHGFGGAAESESGR